MHKVRLTPEAAADLIGIKTYISATLGNPIAAAGTVRRIIKSLRNLESHPEAGPSLEAKTGFKTDLRFLVCGSYIALYRVEGGDVSVARILNGRQDYMRVLFKDHL